MRKKAVSCVPVVGLFNVDMQFSLSAYRTLFQIKRAFSGLPALPCTTLCNCGINGDRKSLIPRESE